MITMSAFGRKGRLGNQLFQLTFLIGLCEKHKTKLALTKPWVYGKYFKGFQTHEIGQKPYTPVNEGQYHYNPEQFDNLDYVKKNFDFNGYFQTEKYFDHCKDIIHKAFEFTDEYKAAVLKKNKEKFGKRTIAVSIRRGDFVNNPNYAQIPITWYYNAIQKHFPHWKGGLTNVIIFSDDIEYCKLHFGNYENVYYAENWFNNNDKSKYFEENPCAIEQLCMMSMCDHFIISNSTFSWWGAWLGEKKDSRVIRPKENLAGNLKANNNEKDYYPEHWIVDDENKINLKDVTFMIPVSFDHSDRLENMALNVCMLQRYFDTNIIVCEHFSDRFRKYEEYGCEYFKFTGKDFHRTKMLNQMAVRAKTPIIANWDADVFISPLQILQTVEAIRAGADMVFPYDGRFARVPRLPWFKNLEKALDVGIFKNQSFKGMFYADAKSVGGAIFFNRKSFLDGGGENQNFVSYGPEDVERDARFRRLNYNVQRINGVLYHLDHWRGLNSKSHNQFYKQNHDELDKIYSFQPDQLRAYVNTWPWKLTHFTK